jgi:hypothetical protein
MKSEAESTESPTKVTIAAPFPRQCKTCRKTLRSTLYAKLEA